MRGDTEAFGRALRRREALVAEVCALVRMVPRDRRPFPFDEEFTVSPGAALPATPPVN